MNRKIEINLAIYSDDDSMDIEFDLEEYLIEKEIGYFLFRIGNQLEFMINDVNKIKYDLFIEFLRKKNLIFLEQ